MTPGFSLIFGVLLSKSVFLKCLEHNTSPFLGSQMPAAFTSSLFIANTHFLLTFSSVGNQSVSSKRAWWGVRFFSLFVQRSVRVRAKVRVPSSCRSSARRYRLTAQRTRGALPVLRGSGPPCHRCGCGRRASLPQGATRLLRAAAVHLASNRTQSLGE